jgi:hypothetical protein
MIRRFVIPVGGFLHSDGTLSQVEGNPSATVTATSMQAMKLANNVVSYISTTFAVPSDHVANGAFNEPPFSGVTVIWATNSGAADKRVHCEVRFSKTTEITSGSSPVQLRYTFKRNGTGNFFMDSANPASTYRIVTNRTPKEFEEGFFDPVLPHGPAYNGGDLIVLTIVRYGASADDPNDGDMYIYGVEIEYHAEL